MIISDNILGEIEALLIDKSTLLLNDELICETLCKSEYGDYYLITENHSREEIEMIKITKRIAHLIKNNNGK